MLYLNERTIEARGEGVGKGVRGAERKLTESAGFGGGGWYVLAKEVLLPSANSTASVFNGATHNVSASFPTRTPYLPSAPFVASYLHTRNSFCTTVVVNHK